MNHLKSIHFLLFRLFIPFLHTFSDSSYNAATLLWLFPYITMLLLHAAKYSGWLRTPGPRWLMAQAHQLSPVRLRNTCAWIFGSNIGLLLHLHRLFVVLLVATGYIPRVAILNNIAKNARRITLCVMKLIFASAESYDLRAAVLVVPLLDIPIWYLLYSNRLGMPNAWDHVICNGLTTVLGQAVMACLRKRARRQILVHADREENKVPLAKKKID